MTVTEKQINAITRLVNQGVTHGATVLNTMLSSQVNVEVPFIKLLDEEAVRNSAIVREKLLAIVQMAFSGNLEGHLGLVFQKQNALRLIDSLEGDGTEGEEFDVVRSGIYTEIGNIVLNSVMGYISNALDFSLDYVVPRFTEGGVDDLIDQNESGLLIRTRFNVEDLAADGDIILFLEPDSYERLLSKVDTLDN